MNRNSAFTVSDNFITSLLYGISHDLGAPARHIVQITQLLNSLSDTQTLEAKHLRWLELLQESGRTIQNMLGGLSKFALLSNSIDNLSLVDLKLTFEEQLALSRAAIVHDKRDVELNIQFVNQPLMVSKIHWQTLFSCLISNALLYQPKDTFAAIQLDATCTIDDAELRFSLSDHGVGISSSQCAEAVRPFKRCHKKESYPGLGLGLAYCQYIAELNNGSLSIHSSPKDSLKSNRTEVTYTQPLTALMLTEPTDTTKEQNYAV